MKTIGERLLYIRKMGRMTRVYLQEKHDISKNTLRKWEENTLNLSEEKINLLCYVYNSESIYVSREWLKTGKGPKPSFFDKEDNRNKNEIKQLIKNDDLLALEELKHLISLDEENSVYMLYQNDTMNPYYTENCWVFGRKNDNYEECIDRDCIVKIKNMHSLTFRRVYKSEIKNRFNLYFLNQNSIDMENRFINNVEVDFIAPVTWIRKIYEKQN